MSTEDLRHCAVKCDVCGSPIVTYPATGPYPGRLSAWWIIKLFVGPELVVSVRRAGFDHKHDDPIDMCMTCRGRLERELSAHVSAERRHVETVSYSARRCGQKECPCAAPDPEPPSDAPACQAGAP